MRGKIRRPFRGLRDAEPDDLVRRRTVDRLAVERIEPCRGRNRPEMVRNVVDLPAPFDPIKVTISPGITVRLTPFTAAMLP